VLRESGVAAGNRDHATRGALRRSGPATVTSGATLHRRQQDEISRDDRQ
jgi:hypothetical protein